MAVQIEIPYEHSFSSAKSPAETFAYLSDLDKSVAKTFPGLESFTSCGPQQHEWAFEKVGYSGYEFQIRLKTRAEIQAPSHITFHPVGGKGLASLHGGWQLSPEGKGTRVGFKATLSLELPVPGFLKAMARPLAEKEISKLFDRYIQRVEKTLG